MSYIVTKVVKNHVIVKEFNDESSIEIDLGPLKESALDMENIKLIKFIG